MLPFHMSNTHEKYTETYQHWCPQSQEFAGGDHLISAFRNGWELADDIVAVTQYWKSGSRPVTIYHFVLANDSETMIMPVLHNPYIERYIMEQSLTLVYDEAIMQPEYS